MTSVISLLTFALLTASAFATPSLKKNNQQPGPASSSANVTANVGATSAAGIKRGLSFIDAGLTKDFNSGEVSWAYNWESSFSGQIPSGVNYFPMLWSGGSEQTNQWVANANAALANGSTHLLFINEPDELGTSPADAAQQWMQYMQPFAGRATLVSPAVTNSPSPSMGLDWLNQFLIECDECSIDAIALHIFDSATDVAYYQSYITAVGSRYNKPVLITELLATGSVQQQQQFLETMIPFLNGLSFVTHFAWFTTAVNNLVNADGSLTSLGQTYVSS